MLQVHYRYVTGIGTGKYGIHRLAALSHLNLAFNHTKRLTAFGVVEQG